MANKKLLPPGLAYLADNITSKHNILGAARGTGARWAKDLNLPKEAETIFFAGCGYQYASDLESLMSLIRKVDKSAISTELTINLASVPKKLGIDAAGIYSRVMSRGGDTEAQPLRDSVKILRKLGVEFGYLADDEPCCGALLHYIGLHQEFSQHAQEVYDQLKSSGVKQIIGIIPSCTYALRQLITNRDGRSNLEVKHFCQVVAEKLPSLKLQFPRKVKVTYHDPCQLTRYFGLAEEPRRILRAIQNVELVEPDHAKGEWATCCGGGAGFEAVFPELSEILAVNRAKELTDTGAEIIVTQCPGCIMQLKAGLKELDTRGVEVLDLAQIVAMAIEE
ncbi:MAG: (Fe-S)-binding protein [Chloroflexi bacterium]|nr:(Fe-S)-binding protein [Chloroflexota bacterium]MBI2980203.1 (Fe-S)-binding protein [Chloroflexota bacterium]